MQIRPFQPADHDTLLALAPRLTDGIAPWLDPAAVLAAAQGWIASAIANLGPTSAIFVAAANDGQPIGFVSVARHKHFTGEERAYIGELVVGQGHEGRGIAHALLAVVEDWAIAQELPTLELDTGAANSRARRLYRNLGYGEEGVKLVKILNSVTTSQTGRTTE